MEELIRSRREEMGPESKQKLQNLTPQKYGKAAYVQLSYTPSKLADNVVYREVSTMKKMEDNTTKLRILDAENNTLKDKIDTLEQEKQGIEKSLTHQITVYKKIIQDLETKHDVRLSQLQEKFRQEIHIMLQQKETDSKFWQAQKQLLEQENLKLQRIIEQLNQKLSHTHGNLSGTLNQKEKLEIQLKNTLRKLQDTEQKLKSDTERLHTDIQELDRKLYETELDWKSKFEANERNNQKTLESVQKLHRSELANCQSKRAEQAQMKNQEVRELRSTFERESQRLNNIIDNKEKSIENLHQTSNKQKEELLELTRHYENKISSLNNDKSNLESEIDKMDAQTMLLKDDLRATSQANYKEKSFLETRILRLSEDLQLTQINFSAQKTQRIRIQQILNLQLDNLRSNDNRRVSFVNQENSQLHRQVVTLKELLFESSQELQKCKEEFIRMRRDKDELLVQLRSLGLENENLRVSHTREDQTQLQWTHRFTKDRSKNYY